MARVMSQRAVRRFVSVRHARTKIVLADCFEWLSRRRPATVHAVVTDPPFGVEYSEDEQSRLREGNGGIWRLPPAYDGAERIPLPRFSVLTERQMLEIESFFEEWTRAVSRVLVPGAHVLVASTPLLSHRVATAIAAAGLERRGEIIRRTYTLRGGDRPKLAHEEFPGVSVIPRGSYEPWLLFRKPMTLTVRENLRTWGTGGLRRPSTDEPFVDLIDSGMTPRPEREIAPHPSLKPQEFMRAVVRAMLPLGKGVVVDPFAGSGSTLAAAANLGYHAIGIERDRAYYDIAVRAIPQLAALTQRAESVGAAD